MSDVFSHAGPLGFLVLLGTILGLVVSAAAGGLAFTRRRVPLAALLLLPYGLLAVGAVGALLATTGVLDQVSSTEPNQIALVAMGGSWNAMTADWLARWCAAFVLVAATWAAAIGSALMPGTEPRLTPVASIGAAVTSALGALLIALRAWYAGLGSGAYMLAALLLVGGLGVAVAATRRATDDDMFRVAGMRFAASMTMLFAVFHGLRAVDIGNRITAFAANGELLNTTDITKAIELFSATVDPGLTIGLVALFLAVVIAFFGFFAEIGEVVIRYTVFDMFVVVALMIGVGVLRIFEWMNFSSVYAVATNLPAVEMYEDLGADLAASVVARGDASQVVRFADGGYGDVIAKDPVGEWTRFYRWNGRRWRADGYHLADIEIGTERPPLIAVERSMDAAEIIPIIEKAGGKAFLSLRASEVKAGTTVPQELARLQTTFLPVQLNASRDLKAQLWAVAGNPEVNWGPTSWYGTGDDSLDPVKYAANALNNTQAVGVNFIVTERKVADLVTSCMPYLLDGEGLLVEPAQPPTAAGAEGAAPAEGSASGGLEELEELDKATGTVAELPPLTMNNDRWCALTTDTFETLREEAAGTWELPQPENVVMSLRTQGPISDPAEVNALLRRELGGLGYCAGEIVRLGGELRGRMSLQLALSKSGQVYDTQVEEGSKVQSPDMLRCAERRFRKLQFALDEVKEGEEPAPVPEPPSRRGRGRGRAGPPEPPPPPRVFVDLDFR